MKVLEITKDNVQVLLEVENIGVLEDTGIRLTIGDGAYEVYESVLSFELVVLYRTHEKGERLYLLQTENALAPQEEAFVVHSVEVPLVLRYGELLTFLLSKSSEKGIRWILFLRGLEKFDLYTGLNLRDSKKFKKRLKQKLKELHPDKKLSDGFIFNPQEFQEIMEFALKGLTKN